MPTSTDQKDIDISPTGEAPPETIADEAGVTTGRARRRRTTFRWGLAALVSAAVVVAAAAVIVNGSDNTAAVPPAAALPAAAKTPAAPTVVPVSLDEFTVKMPATLKAGKYTFEAENTGTIMHMLMVEKAPVVMEAPNQPSEEEGVALGDTGDFGPGQTKSVTVTLVPGTYVFFCNVPGHWAAGQRTTVTVTA